jgi:8-oxo-dGTP pyrophosphatase MutT (NUDIX family)
MRRVYAWHVRIPREVIIAVRRGSEFLVLHRAPQCGAFWHLVAGAEEPGESAAEAAARELREETGLDVVGDLIDLGRSFAYPLVDEPEYVRERFAADVSEVVVSCFVADVPLRWEPTLNEEHDGYRWCDVGQAEALLYWPEPRELVRALA